MTAEQFESVPVAAIEPPSSNGSDAPPDAPKRRGRPPKDPNDVSPRRPRASKASLELRIGALIAQMNVGVTVAAMFIPGMDPERDPLEPPEIVALAQAIDAEARNHPQFRKYLERALGAGSASQLWLVVGIITARRLARHEIIPSKLDEPLGLALADPKAFAAMMQPVAPTDAEPVAVGAS